MNKLAPFLWFNDNAEEAAEFYLSIFPHARKLDELRSKGVGPWPAGKIATISNKAARLARINALRGPRPLS